MIAMSAFGPCGRWAAFELEAYNGEQRRKEELKLLAKSKSETT
jgi:hypothetical protein